MKELFLLAAIFLLINIVVSLVRVMRGPTDMDRMLSAQVISTQGIALALLLGAAFQFPAAVDLALVFAVLAIVMAVFFVRRYSYRGRPPPDRSDG